MDLTDRKLYSKAKTGFLSGSYLLRNNSTSSRYKVWHYTAVLQQETSHEELYQASWVPCPDAAQPFAVSTKPVSGISSSTAVGEEYCVDFLFLMLYKKCSTMVLKLEEAERR